MRSDHFCQRSRLPSSVNESALRLADLERRDVLAQPQPGHEVRHVLAHRRGLVDAVDVLDLEQLHPVEVDDEVQPGDRVGVRARPVLAAVPDVGPADPAAAVLLGDEVRAVGPGVDQDAVHVGDAALRERRDHARVGAQGGVALVELVDGHVRLAVRVVLPAQHAVLVERDQRLVDRAVVAVPADHDGLALQRGARRGAPPWAARAARSRRSASARRRRGRGGGSRPRPGSRRTTAGRADAGSPRDRPRFARRAQSCGLKAAAASSSPQPTSRASRSSVRSRRTARRASPSRQITTGGRRAPL